MSSLYIVFIFTFSLSILIGLGILIYILARKRYRKLPPSLPRFHRLKYEDHLFPAIINRKGDVQPSPEWYSFAEQLSGSLFQEYGINAIYLVHGTFMGHDPFSALRILEKILPAVFTAKVMEKIRRIAQRKKDEIFFDSANFCTEYANLLQKICGPQILVQNFLWSSGNHHLARLIGSCELILTLHADLAKAHYSKDFKPLLLAHSHGGQLLALLSQFLGESSLANQLFQFIQEHNILNDTILFQDAIQALKSCEFCLVTLGTPVRYPFLESENIRIMHLLNHRDNDFAPLSISGILFTRDGDYSQKWGIPGSDFLAPTQLERTLNSLLTPILGLGLDFNLPKDIMQQESYTHSVGSHYLIDYGDKGTPPKPNFLSSFFGHGIYTRFTTLLFQLHTIRSWLEEVSLGKK